MGIRHQPVVRWIPLAVIMVALALIAGSTQALPAQFGPRAAFAQLEARAGGALDAHWDEASRVPDFITSRDPAVFIPYTPTAAERGNPVAIARGFLDENRGLFGLESFSDNLALVRVEPDPQLNYAHVRVAEVYHGIPVFGKQLILHLDTAGRILAVNGQYTPGIDVPTEPALGKDAAEALALDDLLQVRLNADERARVATEVVHDKTGLMVYVDPTGKATLTWNVLIMTDSPLGQWMYFVNARRPAIAYAFDSAEHIKQRRTFSADNRTSVPGRIVIEEGERARSDTIAQAAHDGAGKVYDYYFNNFKRDGIDGQGSPMISTVHYGSDPQDAENAAWISERQQMIYGDGGKLMKPLALGLDVIGHEFTHGITDATAGLIYQGQSGALNESYSDFFGAMIDRANWTIGEAVVKSPPFPVPYLRSMEDPSAGGRYDQQDPLGSVGQPTTMREYANLPFSRKSDNGGVHVNSGIPNRAAFLIAQAIGKEKTEQIYYRTLTQYLSPQSNFGDAARATMRAATDLFGTTEANAISSAWAQVGVNVTGGTAPTPQPPPAQPPRGPAQPPQQPPTTAAGCTNLIVNGSFESPNSGWTEVTSTHSSVVDPELPHSGTRSAWLGGTDKESVQMIYQDVTIPANATSVRLAYWRQLHFETKGLLGILAGEAHFTTALMNNKGDVQTVIEKLNSSAGDDQWHQAQFDLSQYAGKAIRLGFTAENPKNNISSLFVDDVELLACTTGAPSQPVPASNNDVFVQGTIKNADTGRGIRGAELYVIKPPKNATSAAADDVITDDEVLATGIADANGFFRTDVAIPRGQTYSVIIVAGGFRDVIADGGLAIPGNATSPYTTNASMRPSR